MKEKLRSVMSKLNIKKNRFILTQIFLITKGFVLWFLVDPFRCLINLGLRWIFYFSMKGFLGETLEGASSLSVNGTLGKNPQWTLSVPR